MRNLPAEVPRYCQIRQAERKKVYHMVQALLLILHEKG